MDRECQAWTVVGVFKGKYQRVLFQIIPSGTTYYKLRLDTDDRLESVEKLIGYEPSVSTFIEFIDEHVKICDPRVKDPYRD